MRLVIISHTAHYKTEDGEIVGWGPTVLEINHLTTLFEKIYHCAFLHDENPPDSSVAYTSSKIEFVPLPVSGGKGIGKKFTIFSNMPKTLRIVHDVLKRTDFFQFRAPTGIGVYLIPYLVFFSKKKGWFKYAGNWKQKNPPQAYAFQRWILKKQKFKVTINGSWPNQKEHIITFANPCLTQIEREAGQNCVELKNFDNASEICFVGNLTKKKGFDIFMEAVFQKIDLWKKVHIVGDGNLRKKYDNGCSKVNFHGFIPKNQINKIYAKCNFVVLPSLSEGFPKVIAEAMNFGCIPIVSDISGISQFVKHEVNGFLIKPVTKEELVFIFEKVNGIKNDKLCKMIEINYALASRFTFETYNQHLKDRIL